MTRDHGRLERDLRVALRSVEWDDCDTAELKSRIAMSIAREARGKQPFLMPAILTAITVAVIISVVAAVVSEGDRPASPVPVTGETDPALNLSTWRVGDDRRHMMVAGVVAIGDGCVYLRSATGEKYDVVWPAGWAVERGGTGGWMVVSADRGVVVSMGDEVRGAGGTYSGDLACHVPGASPMVLALDGAPVVFHSN
ncbi:MAG: hypothetical protein QM714_05400 [Nocardioides sp.]|uniref:hypothetical protein n=1 Tax=Nocardioides sp. TaxID=35761 RepID=UPI0039E66054